MRPECRWKEKRSEDSVVGEARIWRLDGRGEIGWGDWLASQEG